MTTEYASPQQYDYARSHLRAAIASLHQAKHALLGDDVLARQTRDAIDTVLDIAVDVNANQGFAKAAVGGSP